jgi:hypothetical protein
MIIESLIIMLMRNKNARERLKATVNTNPELILAMNTV